VEHVVFFPAHDGTPAFRRVANLEDAVRLVEHLRNVEGINEVSCHALTEVPLAFRAYYRVEVPVADEAPAASVPSQPVAADADPVAEPAAEPAAEASATDAEASAVEPVVEPAVEAVAAVAEEPAREPVMASSNGHANDGAKSLGFFA
jgi:hypothetical protein